MYNNFDIYVNKSSNLLIIPFENTSPSELQYIYFLGSGIGNMDGYWIVDDLKFELESFKY